MEPHEAAEKRRELEKKNRALEKEYEQVKNEIKSLHLIIEQKGKKLGDINATIAKNQLEYETYRQFLKKQS